MPGRLPCRTSFWDRFFIDFGSQNPPPKHPCESNYAINLAVKRSIHKNRCLPIHIEIWLHLGAIWAPFWHQKSTNIEEYSPPKGYQKLIRFLYRFLLDFGLILGALLEPCSPPRGPKTPPLGAQSRPRAAQEASRRRLGDVLEPGAAQEASRDPPASILGRFWSILNWFLIDFR